MHGLQLNYQICEWNDMQNVHIERKNEELKCTFVLEKHFNKKEKS